LFNGVGGSGDNFTNTCFDPFVSTSILSANPPFSGTYKPMGYLGNINNGQAGNGTWTLRCIDHYQQDQGNLLSWSITFGTNAQAPFIFTHSNLPIVIINTNNQSIPAEPKIDATMQIIYNGPSLPTYVNDPPNIYNGKVGIEVRGAFSASLPQKPYAFETRDKNNLVTDTSLLGMPPEHDWCLIANYNDKAFVRNTLAYHLFDEMGHYASRTRYCEVILNGQYQGIYVLCEKVKRDKHRVDIKKLDNNDNAGDSLTGGYIFKNDYWDNTNSWLSSYTPINHPSFQVHFVYYYPNPDSITPQQKVYIKNFVNTAEGALYGPSFADTASGYRKYFSETSFLDYFIVNELARNVDGFKKSWFFHKDMDQNNVIAKIKAGPVWDFDWAWKNIYDCSIFQATDGSGWSHDINDCSPDVNSNGWYVRMLQDTNFADHLHCRWANLRSTILDTAYLFNFIDSCATLLDSAQMRHYLQWPILGLNSGAPEVGPIPATFQGEVDALKDWIRLRITWLDQNMPGSLYGCQFTGITEQEHDAYLQVYPNPADDQLHISAPGTITRADLYDALGRNVLTLPSLHTMVADADISSLERGIYFLQVRLADGALLSRKVIID
jgi:hypothetical protein